MFSCHKNKFSNAEVLESFELNSRNTGLLLYPALILFHCTFNLQQSRISISLRLWLKSDVYSENYISYMTFTWSLGDSRDVL